MKTKQILIVLLLSLFVLGPVNAVLADDRPVVPSDPAEYLSVQPEGSDIGGPTEFMAVEVPDDPSE
ncbi:MAG: hypothetical protein JW828_10460 [Sedimentisphaerales bacterium]|nr:hypothetical protein [Sedimentisphaerales bacterium]